MTTTGQLTAKPPVSPHVNLVAIERVGATSWGSAIWSVACTCGATLQSDAPKIKNGKARCRTCNPSMAMQQVAAILATFPASYERIDRKSGLTEGQIRHRLEWMRERGLCHIGAWTRAKEQGSMRPIFHAGPGEDVPCKLKARTRSQYERNYRKRVKKAIQKVESGGAPDDRYARQIALQIVKKTVLRTREQPQSWASALFGTMEARHG